MHLQIVNFNLSNLKHEAYVDFCTAVAPQFAGVAGLISKTWLSDQENNTYGGVYVWESRAAMEEFAASDLFRSVASNPSLANIISRDFEVLDTPSRETGGVKAFAEVG